MEEDNGFAASAHDFFKKGIVGDYVVFELGEDAEDYLDEEDWNYSGWFYITEDADDYSHLSAGKLEVIDDNLVVNSHVHLS